MLRAFLRISPLRAATCHSVVLVKLNRTEREIAGGKHGPAGAMAMRIVADTPRMLGAARLVAGGLGAYRRLPLS